MQPLHERYRVIERIGDGGIGAVFRALDETSGRVVAMKVLPREASGGLRGEFMALARLRHDNIVSVLDYGRTSGGQDFFTMEYVVGPPLLAAVPEVPSPAFYRLVGGVLRALAFVHARGMVHADIKPSNILVDGEQLADDPMGAARLADFGLAARIADPTSKAARGTLLYAAPEVYAGRLDARSDLYAVGVVLYQMAAGTVPYPQTDARALMAAQRRGPPGDPRAHRADLPAGLAELVLGLLDPAPGARPQSADEVLARINDIAGTDFAIADSRPLIDVGGTVFGREHELAVLDRLWREAAAGNGGAVLVRGEPGLGVSRLLGEHKLAVQLQGGRALTASARDPRLGGVASPWSGEADGDEAGIARADAAADAMFEIAGELPLLMVIDDLELADPATGRVIAYLARSARGSRILVCLGLSSVEPPRAPALVRLVDEIELNRHLALAPLDRTALASLVENAFSPDIAAQLAGPLHRASGGNPAHAARALGALVDKGVLARRRGAWVLPEEPVEVTPPPDADSAALARLDRLAAAPRAALCAVSVLRGPFDRDLAAALAAELGGGAHGVIPRDLVSRSGGDRSRRAIRPRSTARWPTRSRSVCSRSTPPPAATSWRAPRCAPPSTASSTTRPGGACTGGPPRSWKRAPPPAGRSPPPRWPVTTWRSATRRPASAGAAAPPRSAPASRTCARRSTGTGGSSRSPRPRAPARSTSGWPTSSPSWATTTRRWSPTSARTSCRPTRPTGSGWPAWPPSSCAGAARVTAPSSS